MDILSKLGLTKYEKQSYKALLNIRKGTATAISEQSKVPITATYPALKELEKKGLIQKLQGEITLFEAITPRKAITELIARKKEELENIKEKAINYSKTLINKEKEKKEKILEIGTGKEFSRELYYIALEKAKKEIMILGWRFDKIKDKYELLHKIKKALKRNITIKLILTGKEKKKEELIQAYKETGINIRYLPLENFSILISDTFSCKITLKKKGKTKTTIQILDKDFIQAMKQYYNTLWKKAQKL